MQLLNGEISADYNNIRLGLQIWEFDVTFRSISILLVQESGLLRETYRPFITY